MRGVAGDGEAHRARTDEAAGGFDARDSARGLSQPRDLAMLDDVDTARVRGMGEAPCDGVVSRGAAAALAVQKAGRRIPRTTSTVTAWRPG